MTPPPLPLTGERTVPDVPDEAYWYARHVVAYVLAGGLLQDGVVGSPAEAVVLDAGCGEGYGLALLRDAGAGRVVGADLDAPTVEHARARYGGAQVEVVQCELMTLPLADDAVDLTVSFQVIEHVHDVAGYLASLRRVTRPGGVVVLATPNRLTFTPDSEVPVNPFHHIEFAPDELATSVTRAGLVVERLLGVHHGERITSWEQAHGTSFTGPMTAGPPDAWQPAFRAAVHATTPADFVVTEDDLDASLDLVAVCAVPGAGGVR